MEAGPDVKLSSFSRDVEKRFEEYGVSNAYSISFDKRQYPEVVPAKKGGDKILDTYKNLGWLLNYFHAEIKYNLMTRKREISLPGQFIFKDDEENSALNRVEYLATLNGMPNKNIDRFLDQLASENAYHPIVEHLKDNKWDGVSRLDSFLLTLRSPNQELSNKLLKTWLTACIAAAHTETGFVNHGVLVLQGPQGIGKTSWIKSLDPINCGAVKDGALLDPTNKDSIIGLNRFWIVELGELDATLNKTDIARIKSFITTHADDVRAPWGRKETHLIRRTAYIATVNESSFLVDTTGNRRWWTTPVVECNYQHNFNMTQVWAEVLHYWLEGELTYLDANVQAEVNTTNRNHEKVDPIKELLFKNYDWDVEKIRTISATEILQEIGFIMPSIGECMRAGKILSDMGRKSPAQVKGRSVYSVPEKKCFSGIY
jgi:putative DNA primase/helicase